MPIIDSLPHDVDIRDLDRRAVRASAEIVRTATASDLELPTPCAGWTLTDLLAHMTAQHVGFAAAARGRGGDLDAWSVRTHPDPVTAYLAAADEVLHAFREEGALAHTYELPELLPGYGFPAAQAFGFHCLDYVVHSWDVARSLRQAFEPDPETTEAALVLAGQVPDGDFRASPGAAFRPPLGAPAGAGGLERILTLLGRSPDWPA